MNQSSYEDSMLQFRSSNYYISVWLDIWIRIRQADIFFLKSVDIEGGGFDVKIYVSSYLDKTTLKQK